jgi:hypothetical protein
LYMRRKREEGEKGRTEIQRARRKAGRQESKQSKPCWLDLKKKKQWLLTGRE